MSLLRNKEPIVAAEEKQKLAEPPGDSGWPQLVARMMEDITRSELGRFEANFSGAVKASTDRAIASLFRLAASLVGGGCLLAALVLLFHNWLPVWLSLAITGGAIVGIGEIIYSRHINRAL
jgi:hypothetical protein